MIIQDHMIHLDIDRRISLIICNPSKHEKILKEEGNDKMNEMIGQESTNFGRNHVKKSTSTASSWGSFL